MPLPIQAAAAALWRDEAHVEENRARYRRKFDIAEAALGGRFGFYRPQGGFFLWLDVGDGERAALRLWRDAAVRVLPGGYTARAADGRENPGGRYIRLAIVHDEATLEAAFARIARVLPYCRDVRRLGSAELDLCYVAAGIYDGYWEQSLAPYDMAAGAVVPENGWSWIGVTVSDAPAAQYGSDPELHVSRSSRPSPL